MKVGGGGGLIGQEMRVGKKEGRERGKGGTGGKER